MCSSIYVHMLVSVLRSVLITSTVPNHVAFLLSRLLDMVCDDQYRSEYLIDWSLLQFSIEP
jgi:hypothetical protein